MTGRVSTSGRVAIPGGQNLLSYSENFANGNWANTGFCTLTANTIANPVDGAITASTISDSVDVGAQGHQINQSLSTQTGKTYTYSLYAKNIYSFVSGLFLAFNVGANTDGTYFDLVNGTKLDTGTVISSSMVSLGSGWYRCITTISARSTTSNIYLKLIIPPSTENYVGGGNDIHHIFGAELNNANVPVAFPYTRTTGLPIDTGIPRVFSSGRIPVSGRI